jgi:hypothetical protein
LVPEDTHDDAIIKMTVDANASDIKLWLGWLGFFIV